MPRNGRRNPARNQERILKAATEEVMCLPLAAGQTVYVYVDEAALTTIGGQFMLQVEQCVRETEPNDLPILANSLSCGIEGSMRRTPTPTPTATTAGDATITPTPSNTPTTVGAPTSTATFSLGENDFFVLPTYYDPCSLVVFEALACGLPVITTRCNGAGELISEGREGFVVDRPDDVEALASALERMTDDASRAAMSARATRLGREQSFDRHVARLVELFEEVAAEKKAGRRTHLPRGRRTAVGST